MSNLSELLPSGGGGGKVAEFTASGTLPNGKPVVLKSDGTVEVVAESSTSVSESIPESSEVVFNSGSTSNLSVAFNPNDSGTFVIAYADYGNNASVTLVIGTISGTSLSFGTPSVVETDCQKISISFDPSGSGKFILTYQSGSQSNKGIVKIGTVSGTNISLSSQVVFSSNAGNTDVAWDSTGSKAVIAYKDGSSSDYGKAVVATISGTNISLGNAVTYHSGSTDLARITCLNTDEYIVAFKASSGNSSSVTHGTVSGTTITFGTPASIGYTSDDIDVTPISSTKFAVAWRGTSEVGFVQIGSVSGTTISLGTAVSVGTVNSHITVESGANTPNTFIISYGLQSNSNYGTVRVGTVSGTTISLGSTYTFNSGTTPQVRSAFDPNNAGNFVICYRDQGNSHYGTARTGQIATTVTVTNLTESDYIGFSEAAYTNGQTASVMLKGGVSTTQSGLTVGSDYYVQGDGTLDTTADTVSVEAGKAVSATTLLLRGN